MQGLRALEYGLHTLHGAHLTLQPVFFPSCLELQASDACSIAAITAPDLWGTSPFPTGGGTCGSVGKGEKEGELRGRKEEGESRKAKL